MSGFSNSWLAYEIFLLAAILKFHQQLLIKDEHAPAGGHIVAVELHLLARPDHLNGSIIHHVIPNESHIAGWKALL